MHGIQPGVGSKPCCWRILLAWLARAPAAQRTSSCMLCAWLPTQRLPGPPRRASTSCSSLTLGPSNLAQPLGVCVRGPDSKRKPRTQTGRAQDEAAAGCARPLVSLTGAVLAQPCAAAVNAPPCTLPACDAPGGASRAQLSGPLCRTGTPCSSLSPLSPALAPDFRALGLHPGARARDQAPRLLQDVPPLRSGPGSCCADLVARSAHS